MTTSVPDAELRALASGESIVAFGASGATAPGDRIDLVSAPGDDPGSLAPAYRRWASDPPPGAWTAEVVEVHPVVRFDPEALAARHIRADTPATGDVLLLRVSGAAGPVLSDTAFAARLRSVHGALL